MVVAMWLVVTIGVRVAYANRVLPGTTMAGQDLGGLSGEAAHRLLTKALASPRTVTLTAAGERFVVDPEAVGYSVDVTASLERARDAGREGIAAIGSAIPSLISARQLEPVVRIDRARLAAQIASIAQAVDRRAAAGAVRVDPRAPEGIHVTAPRAQRTLQRGPARAALLRALKDRATGPVALPVRKQGGATAAAVQEVARRARVYLRTPVQLVAGERTLTLRTRQTASILALRRGAKAADDGALTLGVDPAAAARLVADLARNVDREPSDARIRAPARPRIALEKHGDVDWRPRRADVSVTPAAAGRRLRQAKVTAALTDAVRRASHRVQLAFERRRPRVSTAAARGVRSLIGTFTTRYACCQPRVTNIRLITKAIDGTVVMPGEPFSLNQSSGERTRAGGYVKAPFIADGELAESIGGGVSQVSTTLYNAAYFAGLQIDAHRPHSFYIDRYPPGREATLNFPDIDLRWTNDTPAPVLIRAATDETSVVVSLYGADTGRRVRAQSGPRTPVTDRDFAITVTRVLRFRDGKVDRQPYTTTYDRPPPPD
ncbi:MAG: VanW family protein [Solirubrobacteraceae bacterium]|nr:VanW family protein [Solirubrobacteraceae bacterium]